MTTNTPADFDEVVIGSIIPTTAAPPPLDVQRAILGGASVHVSIAGPGDGDYDVTPSEWQTGIAVVEGETFVTPLDADTVRPAFDPPDEAGEDGGLLFIEDSAPSIEITGSDLFPGEELLHVVVPAEPTPIPEFLKGDAPLSREEEYSVARAAGDPHEALTFGPTPDAANLYDPARDTDFKKEYLRLVGGVPAWPAGTKPNNAENPKDAIGSSKLPLHLWPMTASAFGSIGLLNGMLKYGRTNWRAAGVRPSIYVDAAIRHIWDWFEGNDYDPEDGCHNLGGALACLAILVDAMCAGELNDDRQFNGKGWRVARAQMEPMVAKLKALHAARNPRHFTIADNLPEKA